MEIKEDIQNLKADFVSKPEFNNLEARVSVLETKGVASEEDKSLRQQVSRLDPANKSLRFRAFKDADLSVRVRIIEHCLSHIGVKSSNVEHIYKGPPGQRELTDMCIVEFGSNSVREQALKELNKHKIHDASDQELLVDRAKTANQLQRNNYLRKVSDALKKEPTCKDKSVIIVWQQDDRKDKNRTITVGGETAFCQTTDDVKGTFVSPFSCAV